MNRIAGMASETETAPVRGTADEIAFAGAARQAEMVRSGEISPTELVQLHLERIERLDPQLNAFGSSSPSGRWPRPQQAEARLKAGEERPLLGVPIALKDGHDLAGELSHHGTDAFPEPAGSDSEMVRRLRAAGAIIVGKTHLPELAIHGFTESATWGVTRNPWNPQRSTGGSSGGSAAAVAAGLVPLASASRRRRLDPHPRRLLRGLRPEAAAAGRISLVPDAWFLRGALARTVGQRVREPRRRSTRRSSSTSPSGGSREAGAPPPPERPFAEAAASGRRGRCGSRPRPSRCARSPPPIVSERGQAARSPRRRELLRSLGHRVEQRDPDWGYVGNNVAARYLRGIHDDVATRPAARAARAADARLRPARRADLRRGCAGAPRRGARDRDRGRIGASSTSSTS